MVLKRERGDSAQAETSAVADSSNSLSQVSEINNEPTPSPPRKFKCKTCNREFSKFQALGGHRASHRKPANPRSNGQEPDPELKMHECSICGAQFCIGQALGGHMRKHRELLKEAKPNSARTRFRLVHEILATSEAESVSEKPGSARESLRVGKPKRKKVNLYLDLNLTPAENDL